MGFGKNKWLKIWEITKREDNFTEVRVSSSRKNKNGEYETDFSGFVRLIGEAHKAAKNLSEGDTIRVQACETTNTYDKAKGITYWNCAVFNYDNGGDDGQGEEPKKKTSYQPTEGMEDEKPW